MKIKINAINNKNYINNVAFIKALLIKENIENLDISYEEKIQVKNKVLEYLQNN